MSIIPARSTTEEALVQVSSTFVGTTLKEYTADVTWRRTMNYAAGTGDMNPWYLDDEREGGIIAPPMFAVCCYVAYFGTNLGVH